MRTYRALEYTPTTCPGINFLCLLLQVLLGYFVAALIVVLVVTLFYVVAFDPGNDPFATGDQAGSANFRQNPFDAFLASYRRKQIESFRLAFSPTKNINVGHNMKLATGGMNAENPSHPLAGRWSEALRKVRWGPIYTHLSY
jgi:hypothetical protein